MPKFGPKLGHRPPRVSPSFAPRLYRPPRRSATTRHQLPVLVCAQRGKSGRGILRVKPRAAPIWRLLGGSCMVPASKRTCAWDASAAACRIARMARQLALQRGIAACPRWPDADNEAWVLVGHGRCRRVVENAVDGAGARRRGRSRPTLERSGADCRRPALRRHGRNAQSHRADAQPRCARHAQRLVLRLLCHDVHLPHQPRQHVSRPVCPPPQDLGFRHAVVGKPDGSQLLQSVPRHPQGRLRRQVGARRSLAHAALRLLGRVLGPGALLRDFPSTKTGI